MAASHLPLNLHLVQYWSVVSVRNERTTCRHRTKNIKKKYWWQQTKPNIQEKKFLLAIIKTFTSPLHYRYNVEVMDGSGARGAGVRAEVRITSVAPQDSSVIACTATNKYGSHIHHMELRVQGKPWLYSIIGRCTPTHPATHPLPLLPTHIR